MLTHDDVIRLAREAGFEVGRDAGGEYVAPQYSDSVGTLVRFAALVAAAEREECAMVCDERAMKNENSAQEAESDDDATGLRAAAWQMSICAATIRACGEKGGK